MVYVVSQNNEPLMPTNRHGKVRHLLKLGKAKVIKREPFTIKLLYETTDYKQDLTLGVDTGSGTFATAVSNNKNEIIYMSEVALRNDIYDKMIRRASYRRTRRNRKTRYRKPRFLNCKNSIKTDRFSPTMTSKFNSHIKEIEFIKSILPIKNLVLETGTFDPHLMKNPALYNENYRKWGYQHGPNYGYANTRNKVLNRDNYTCQCCKGKRKNSRLDVHHIVFRSNGGDDTEENLITLCHLCHEDLHNGKINPKFNGKKRGNLKYATQMNSIRTQLLRHYKEAIETFGYVTKENRFNLNIPKEHYFDACVISTGGNPLKFNTDIVYFKKSVSDGDYRQTDGRHSEKHLTTGKIYGFRKFDKVLYKNNIYFVFGRMSSGYAKLMNIKNNIQIFTNPKIPKFINMKRISARKSVITQGIKVNLPIVL